MSDLIGELRSMYGQTIQSERHNGLVLSRMLNKIAVNPDKSQRMRALYWAYSQVGDGYMLAAASSQQTIDQIDQFIRHDAWSKSGVPSGILALCLYAMPYVAPGHQVDVEVDVQGIIEFQYANSMTSEFRTESITVTCDQIRLDNFRITRFDHIGAAMLLGVFRREAGNSTVETRRICAGVNSSNLNGYCSRCGVPFGSFINQHPHGPWQLQCADPNWYFLDSSENPGDLYKSEDLGYLMDRAIIPNPPKDPYSGDNAASNVLLHRPTAHPNMKREIISARAGKQLAFCTTCEPLSHGIPITGMHTTEPEWISW